MDRFTAVASERLRPSERLIQRAARRYRFIAPDVRERIAGTWLAYHGSDLDFLTRLTPDMQRKVIALMEERGARGGLKHLHAELASHRIPIPDPDQAQLDALVKLWRRTGAKARRMFEAELAKDAQFNLESPNE